MSASKLEEIADGMLAISDQAETTAGHLASWVEHFEGSTARVIAIIGGTSTGRDVEIVTHFEAASKA